VPEAHDDRKLAAILAADVAGYSRLMETDERDTIATLDNYRSVFRETATGHGGRIVDTAGDSVLAIFPSAIAAVEAALNVQRELHDRNQQHQVQRQMLFRIGINLGDVIEKTDGSIYGSGVNVAARLESLAEPNGITISEDVFRQVDGKIDSGFEYAGEHEVKNIARPVRAYRALIGGGAGSRTSGTRVSSVIDKPSIAVLPFNNLSGDAEQEHFSDGMTEDLITLLSTVPELFVIARNSAFAYKGKSTDVREVAADLGVRYVLEGGVRKAENRIRVTAQFVDAESGNHIWADKYDRDLDDIFAVQDEVSQGIVGALQSRLLVAEASILSRKPPAVLDAWGNIVKAKIKLFAFRGEDIDEAEPFARRAIEIDPDYAEAHAVLAHILAWRSYNGWADDWYQTAKDAVSESDQALALAPNDPAVLTDVGFTQWHLGRFLKAVPILERAVALNPNSALTCMLCGTAVAVVDRTDEGIALIERAFRLSPKDPLEYLFHSYMALPRLLAGQFEEAKASANRALHMRPNLIAAEMFCVAACVRLGQLDEARRILQRIEKAGYGLAIDNIFKPRTEGTIWRNYTDAIREAMDRDPKI
jgi:TolB-like protein